MSELRSMRTDRVYHDHLTVIVGVRDRHNDVSEHETKITIAYRWVDRGVAVGIAFKSPEEAFNRRRGRLIAEGRMLKHPVVLGYSEPPQLPDVRERAVQELVGYFEADYIGFRGQPERWVSLRLAELK